jgi:thiol:disulfide interchange protein
MHTKMSCSRFTRAIVLLAVLLAPGLPALGQTQQSPAPGLSQRLSDLLQPKPDRLLEPEQAFRLRVTAKTPMMLSAELIPADGYYLYKSRIHFTLEDSPGVAIAAVKLPPGKSKKDLTFGTTEVYLQPVQAEIMLDRKTNASRASSVRLVASYQGCHEKTGVCYPPVHTELTLALPPAK